MSIDLSVVVVSYNTRQLTLKCLTSLFEALAESDLIAEVWVVDNASEDGSAESVGREFPQARLIAGDENLGFARATNRALEAIGASDSLPRHVLLLNPDTVVARDALPLMVRFLDDHAKVGIVGAQLTYGNGSFQHSAFHFPTLLMTFFDFWPLHHRLSDSSLNGRYPRGLYERGAPFRIDHPLGAALMARWQALAQVGPLDPGFFMYCEEVDWCIRFRRGGWEIYCVPKARITHYAGQSARQFRNQMFVELWRSRYRLFRKHYSRAYQTLARFIVRAGLRREMRRTTAALRAGRLSPQEAQRRIAAYQEIVGL